MKISQFIKSAYSFITHDLWRITDAELSKHKRIPFRLLKVIMIAIKGVGRDNLFINASALTYSVMFALVPLIALFIAIGKGFGIEDSIKVWIAELMAAQKELIPFIMSFVDRYLESAQGGVFIGVGVVILLVSVMNLLNSVERTFNNIWQVNKSRSLLRQFTSYFSSLFIIPIIIAVTGGINIYFSNLLDQLQLTQVLSPLLTFGMKTTPYVVSWIVFTVIYLSVPNTRVKFQNGMIAGIVAGTAFQFFQMIYIEGQSYLSRYDLVYGSFAAIPLLLLWLQISFTILLLGAEISYASQNLQNYDYEGDTKNISIRYKRFISLFLTFVIVRRFENQEQPVKDEEFSTMYKLPIRLVNQVLSELTEARIVTEIVDEDFKSKAYQPAMDIHQLSIKTLFDKMESEGAELFLSNKNEELDRLWNIYVLLDKPDHQPDREILIKDLLNE
ncbi:MAG: YihY/virulence factor BrkB family protein [Paludibacter sp.]|jgi:membrane protein|nr:YihY/virulence factor BrkB family protein [Paludibacter sp.]